jgi:hypothetical protein
MTQRSLFVAITGFEQSIIARVKALRAAAHMMVDNNWERDCGQALDSLSTALNPPSGWKLTPTSSAGRAASSSKEG